MTSSNVRLASSIIAQSSPSSASFSTLRGSFPSSSRPSELARRLAGSIVTTATLRPRAAIPSAIAADVVVLPTPPDPAQMQTRLPSSISATFTADDCRSRIHWCCAGAAGRGGRGSSGEQADLAEDRDGVGVDVLPGDPPVIVEGDDVHPLPLDAAAARRGHELAPPELRRVGRRRRPLLDDQRLAHVEAACREPDVGPRGEDPPDVLP